MNKYSIPQEEFNKLFYLRKDWWKRVPPILPALDDQGKFHAWVPMRNKIIETPSCRPVECSYIAKGKASNSDFYLEFLNFMFQRVTGIFKFSIVYDIINDILNLSISLSKIEIFHQLRKKQLAIRFVATEIEYIFIVCRSLYDLLQVVVKNIWQSIELLDKKIRKNELKDSFARMALKDNNPISPEDIQTRYGLPLPIAEFYNKEAYFFNVLREYRTNIEHSGYTPLDIFITDKGFAVDGNYEPFSSFGVWDTTTFLKNNLAPLRPILAYVIHRTLQSLNNFIEVLKPTIKFPEEIAPSYKIFLRGVQTKQLVNLTSYISRDM